METQDQVLQAIYGAIETINEELAAEKSLSKAPDTVLIGPGGRLDSLQFVRFTVDVETNLEQSLGVRASVMDAVDFEAGELTVSALAQRIGDTLQD